MKKYLSILVIMIAAGACKKHETVKPGPSAAVYLAPTPDAPCTPSGFVNDSTGTVDFQWKTAGNADSYIITVTNLLSNKSNTYSTRNLYLTLPLVLATPYSWNITSVQSSSGEKASSDTWKFYVAGKGVITYAPFPATIGAPVFGAIVPAGTVNLSWTGSDMEPGKLTYSVYLDTLQSPALLNANITDMFLNDVSIKSGKTYYWHVLTFDAEGNSSDSGIYQFLVQ